MSLNTILASAQKLGMPVVITDRQGENAQVVMPFDDFVALAQSATGEGKYGMASGSRDDLDLGAFAVEEDPMAFSMGDLDEEIQTEMDRAAASQSESQKGLFSADPFSSVPSDSVEAGMEEKFYLEPLGEGEENQ